MADVDSNDNLIKRACFSVTGCVTLPISVGSYLISWCLIKGVNSTNVNAAI